MGTGHLTIDLDAVAANWRDLARLSGGAETGAVVKADAYGLGMGPVARRLAAEGARAFFVAFAEEGAALRAILGPGPGIFVLTGHMAGDAVAIRDHGLVPLLSSPDQVARHREALPGHAFGLQLCTGMNRLGIAAADWPALRAALPGRPVLVTSHLACADEPGHPMNAAQLAAFRAMTDGEGWRRSLAATGGILLGPDYHFDLTRAGVGMYGAAPHPAGRQAVRLDLPVVQLRDVARGETVGYAAAWTAPRPSRIAIVAGGYADGLFRSLAGRLRLWAGDVPAPAVGRVSMDLIACDVTGAGEVPAALGVIGPQQGIDAVAEAAGTIGYEVLTALGARYARHYGGAAA